MTWSEFWIIFAICALTILISRVVPLFVLKGKELPVKFRKALHLIPPAAFAALVANDLLTPGMFAMGFWPADMPLVAALVVVVVARLTKSLAWCAVAGVIVYYLLTLI